MVGNSIVTNKGYNANTGRITRINTTLGNNIFQDLIYSYDDFGNFALRRKMNSPVISETFTYDNINTTFDRGFCMHEHYRDFGLINMSGRMYDPLVGRMLSPDIVIQNPEYSQSYHRYSYCFNNPLRFTDPSGYVVRNIWPNREVEFKFADPSPKRLLYDHKTSIDNFILPKYIESMQFIEFNLKSK